MGKLHVADCIHLRTSAIGMLRFKLVDASTGRIGQTLA